MGMSFGIVSRDHDISGASDSKTAMRAGHVLAVVVRRLDARLRAATPALPSFDGDGRPWWLVDGWDSCSNPGTPSAESARSSSGSSH